MPTGFVPTGMLHVYVAFDWGDEIDLQKVLDISKALKLDLPRRRRTPRSFGYRPLPIRYPLDMAPTVIEEIGRCTPAADVTIFDFAAVSVALHLPLELEMEALSRLAATFAEPDAWIELARASVTPLFELVKAAIQNVDWKEELSEEYFVFQFRLEDGLSASIASGDLAPWLARLIRLEEGELSREEIAEALRMQLRYTQEDLFVPDWAAACLIDDDCEETLQTIEFANLQLLEYRHIDQRLDDVLTQGYGLLHTSVRRSLPWWRSSFRALRAVGELKVEAAGLFERTGNVLKLVGDQYLARVHRLLGARFHLADWEEGIRRKLEVTQGVYEVLSDQAAAYRLEFLELIVILLILIEILLTISGH